ncbi:MAG: nitrate/nitrite transporter NrtS [Proteobacteria bacterium]|nr:nitrate/nitrite transporter NrtS [Pseudomonadota bacterium]
MRKAASWPIAVRSLSIAFVVGTILNAINQGAEIVDGKPVNLLRLVLTYAVPFFVASYGAYSAFSRMGSHGE